MRIKETVKGLLETKQNRRYEALYRKAREAADYSTGVTRVEEEALSWWRAQVKDLQLKEIQVCLMDFSAPVSRTTFSGKKSGTLLLAHSEGKLSQEAPFLAAAWYALHPDTWLLYGDEDHMEENGKRISPWLKPAWSPDLFLSCFYFGSVLAVRRDVLQEAFCQESMSLYELCSRIANKAGGFEPGIPNARIGHIGAVLFHHRDGKDGIRRYLKQAGPAFVQPFLRTNIMVSVIIPSKDQPEVLSRNLRSLQQTVTGIPYEIIIVDNGSCQENKRKIEKLKEELTARLEYIYSPMPFHFSRMCNLGAQKAKGSLLLFLNDDIESAEPGWMESMAQKSLQPHTGAVGAKLLYPGSHKIQHAGITNLPMGPVHKLQFHSDSVEHYYGRNRMTWNVTAVTGACLMIRKELFWECGGFSMALPVAFNDVDLGFTLLEKGYYNAVMNEIRLYHYESLSRGDDESPEKLKRLAGELAVLYARHPQMRGTDPFYHPWLNHKMLDTGIRPAFETATPGTASAVKLQRDGGSLWKGLKAGKDIRLHPGVHVRIEAVSGSYVQGYALMLGDNNACYKRYLVLSPMPEEQGGSEKECRERDMADWKKRLPAETEQTLKGNLDGLYMVPLNHELRPDLQENMPEQHNVAMSGFALEVRDLPLGEYAIGALLENCVTGVMYLNWSRRSLQEGRSEDGLQRSL